MDELAVFVLCLRLGLPLLILRFPLIGTLLCAAVDVADYSFMGTSENYQQLDKLLDTYYLSFAAVTVLRWKDDLARKIALGLYAWRVMGVLLVLLTDQRWLLMAFPNFFEPLFVFYLLFVYLARSSRLMTSGWVVMIVATVLFVPKLTQEYILHIYQPAVDQAPAWISYTVNHFAWLAIPLYILPVAIALAWYVCRARRAHK